MANTGMKMNMPWPPIKVNATATPKDFAGKLTEQWIGVLVASAILATIALYLAGALCHYMYLATRRSRVDRNSSQSSQYGGGSRRTAKFGRSLRYLCMFTALFTVVTSSTGLGGAVAYFFVPDPTLCVLLAKVHMALRAVNEILLNSILWLRQKIFYMHPAMRQISSTTTSFVSWLFYFVMIIATLLTLTVFALVGSAKRDSDAGTCVVNTSGKMEDLWETVILGGTLALIIVYRLLFLGLLLYPLIKHRRHSLNLNCGSGGNRNVKELMAVIKRILLADMLCITIFIGVTVLNSILSTRSVFVRTGLWDLELVLGFVFIMMSFIDWKCRLFPACFKLKKRQRGSSKQSLTAARVSVWSTAN